MHFKFIIINIKNYINIHANLKLWFYAFKTIKIYEIQYYSQIGLFNSGCTGSTKTHLWLVDPQANLTLGRLRFCQPSAT